MRSGSRACLWVAVTATSPRTQCTCGRRASAHGRPSDRGIPENDAYHNSTARLLARGEADVLLWISSLSEMRTPPSTGIPTILLGRAGMVSEREPEVFIPVGIPGVDHAGHLFRTDRVVALPVERLRPSALPSVAEAITAIDTAIGGI